MNCFKVFWHGEEFFQPLAYAEDGHSSTWVPVLSSEPGLGWGQQ